MKSRIIETEDGSHSLYVDELRESYHSERGSLQESQHTFINAGLRHLMELFPREQKSIKIFEMGFGTGLNAYLTALIAADEKITVEYTGVEAYPLKNDIYTKLNYPTILGKDSDELFLDLHESPWNEWADVHPFFKLKKIEAELENLKLSETYDLVYFDAFAPNVQAQLWTEEIFVKLYGAMNPKSVLTTYSAAGAPRRAMQKAGFWMEELRGAVGKREMTRCIKW